MPIFLKVLLSLVIGIACVFTGGGIGAWLAWLSVRNVPPSQDSAGDGIGVIFFGMLGMVIGCFVGIISIMAFWTALRNRSTAKSGPGIHPQEGVWPPPPRR